MEGKLQKPQFVKVSSLENARDGYNVYVKVVSVEHTKSENGLEMARAVVADESGAANAFFKGETTKLIQKDSVIAIRNGKIKIIQSHISLQIDLFGRVTKEDQKIDANTTKNISQQEIQRKPRGPRREGNDDRKPRRDRGDYDRKPRRDNEDRKPRRQRDEREPREPRDNREPREPRENRKPRREDDERRPARKDYDDKDRKPREPREDRRPRRDYEERKPRNDDRNKGDERPKMEWTKIGAVEPGDERLNIIAKVISVEPLKTKMRVLLGDETAIVKAFLPENEDIKEGNTVVIFKCEARVVKEHIEIQLMRPGRIEASRNKKITEIEDSVDISHKAWVESP